MATGRNPSIEKIRSPDEVVNRVQDKLAQSLKAPLSNPLLSATDWRFNESNGPTLGGSATTQKLLQLQCRSGTTWTTVFSLDLAAALTKGDLLVATAAGVLSRLAASTSGYVLTANGAGAAPSWQAATGGTAPWTFAEKPTVADSRDEEFEGTAFSGWTQGGLPDATAINPYGDAQDTKWRYSWNGTRRSHLLLQAQTGGGGGPNYMPPIYKAVTLGTNELISTRMSIDGTTAIAGGDSLIGFMLYTGAGAPDVSAVTTDRVALYLNASGVGQYKIQFDKAIAGVVTAQTYNINGPVTNGFGNVLEPIEYLWIHKIGTTYHAFCAASPGNITYLGNLTYAGTVDHIAVILGNATLHAPGAARAAVDFFRFKATATELP